MQKISYLYRDSSQIIPNAANPAVPIGQIGMAQQFATYDRPGAMRVDSIEFDQSRGGYVITKTGFRTVVIPGNRAAFAFLEDEPAKAESPKSPEVKAPDQAAELMNQSPKAETTSRKPPRKGPAAA